MFDNILKIENFGSIFNVEINISKSSILMGSNGSGKSFTGLVLYSIRNLIENKTDNELYNLGLESFNLLNTNKTDLTQEYIKKFETYIKNKPSFSSKPLKIDKKEFKTLLLNGIGHKYGELLENKLLEVFDVGNLDELIKYNENYFKISFNNIICSKIRNKDFTVEKFFNNSFLEDNHISNYTKGSIEKSEFAVNEDENYYYFYLDYDFIKNKGKYKDNMVFPLVYTLISKSIFKQFNSSNSFYIPYGREELIKNKNKFISRNLKKPMYLSNTQRNLAFNLFKLKPNNKKGDFEEIAKGIEKEIIGGEINIEENEVNTDFYFTDKDNNLNLPLKLLSSGIHNLSILVLYLKYLLKKGDILIIEEPEAHLHPKEQIKLVKYLVELINSGLTIFITTHSDFIVGQFNNHIRLDNITLENFKKHFERYTHIDKLNFNDINLYSFKFIDKYSAVSEKILINHTGFDGFAFSDVTEELYDETMKITDLK